MENEGPLLKQLLGRCLKEVESCLEVSRSRTIQWAS